MSTSHPTPSSATDHTPSFLLHRFHHHPGIHTPSPSSLPLPLPDWHPIRINQNQLQGLTTTIPGHEPHLLSSNLSNSPLLNQHYHRQFYHHSGHSSAAAISTAPAAAATSTTSTVEQLFISTNSKVVRLYDLKRSPVHFLPALLAERGIPRPVSVWTLATSPVNVHGVSQPINDAQVTQLWLVFATHEAVRNMELSSFLLSHPLYVCVRATMCPPPFTLSFISLGCARLDML